MLPLPLQFMAAWLAVWLGRVLQEQIDYLKAENQLLQEKLGTKRVRLTDAERRRLATLGKALGRKGLAAVATIASPETILRWYRELVAKKYDGSQQRGQGRPKTLAEVAALVVRMARENTWGYTRIKGALMNLGHKVGRNTIKRILQEHGIDPAPERAANVLGDFHQGASGRAGRYGLFHRGGRHLARADSLPRAVCDRYCEQEGGDSWNCGKPWWPLDGTDRTKPCRCTRRIPGWQAVSTTRPGSIVHASIPTNPGPSWRQDSEVARTQSESERFRRAICAFD